MSFLPCVDKDTDSMKSIILIKFLLLPTALPKIKGPSLFSHVYIS